MNQEEESLKTMKTLKEIFDRHKIEYWLDEGTLLGAVREKKFIEWDHDIDFGVWVETIPKIIPLFDEIRKEGIEICYFDWKQHIKFLSRGYEIDVFAYHLKNGNATRTWYAHNKLGRIIDSAIWTLHLGKLKYRKSQAPFLTKIILAVRSTLPKKINKKLLRILLHLYWKIGCTFVNIAVPRHFFTQLSKIEFYKMKFNAPKDKEEYLKHRYGNWKVPKRDYVFYEDDQSIVKKQI